MAELKVRISYATGKHYSLSIAYQSFTNEKDDKIVYLRMFVYTPRTPKLFLCSLKSTYQITPPLSATSMDVM
ncbi:MAG: hypothetical protein RXQ75_09345 [Acidianus hospitalis]